MRAPPEGSARVLLGLRWICARNPQGPLGRLERRAAGNAQRGPARGGRAGMLGALAPPEVCGVVVW
jgi:hypothetical protein